MIIFKIYRYLYYKFYTWAVWLNENDDIPEYRAVFLLAAFSFMNLLTILIDFDYLTGYKLQHFIFSSKVKQYIIGPAYVYLIYYIILKKIKLNAILDEFKNEKITTSKIGNVLAGLYLIISMTLFTPTQF